MAASYREINYRLRPAKSVERKMIVDALRHLRAFGELAQYRYVGFGSVFFVDFELIHRALGMSEMVSIERRVDDKERFLYNKPFDCIDMQFGESNDVLSKLRWDVRSIVWLDYDGNLNNDVLSDVQQVCGAVEPGSVFLVTVNGHAPREETTSAAGKRTPLDVLSGWVGANRVPIDLKEKDLQGWGAAKAYCRIITNMIEETLANRNGPRSKSAHMHYQQIFNFHYQDNARMVTVGGVLFDEGQRSILDSAGFSRVPYLRMDDTPYMIEVPNLTPKEVQGLDALLPGKDAAEIATEIPVSVEDIRKYKAVYRYYPSFSELET